MNRYAKEFFFRGLIFAGFGPIIMGIIYAILQNSLPDFSLSGSEVCLAILSVYGLAFLQAGTSVFHQIEHWSLPKALAAHFSTLYVAYVGCYLINRWIPFRAEVLAIFTAVFAGSYGIIVLIVSLSVRAVQKKLNEKLRD